MRRSKISREKRAWRAYFRLLRPFTLLPPALGILSAATMAFGAGSGRINLAAIALGALSAVFLNGASNSVNQIFDLEIDRVNKPARPLPSGDISPGEAWGIGIAGYCASLLLAWCVHSTFLAIVAAGALLTIAYSAPPLRAKRHWLAALATIALSRGLLLTAAGWSLTGDICRLEPWWIGGVYALFLLGAAGTKDYADMAGDLGGKCTTLPLRFGIKKSVLIISPFIVCPFYLLPLGSHWKILSANSTGLWLCSTVLSLWGAYAVWLLAQRPDSLLRNENHPSWKHIYGMMLFAQIGLATIYVVL